MRPDPATHRAVVALMLQPEVTPEDRAAAVHWLLQTADRPETVAAFREALSQDAEPAVRAGVLNCIGEYELIPNKIASMLVEAIVALEPDELPAGLAALAGCDTPEAARLLVDQLAEDRPPAVRVAAFAALERMTGFPDRERSRGAWEAWLAEMPSSRSVGFVRETLGHRLTNRRDRDRLNAARSEALTAFATDQVLRAAPEEQDGVIAGLLASDIAEVWSAGLTRARYRHSFTGATAAPVAAAIGKLLRSEDAAKRAGAAAFARALPLPELMPDISAALKAETSARIATDLLIAAAADPPLDAAGAVVRWSIAGPPTRNAAVPIAVRLRLAGALDHEQATLVRGVLSNDWAVTPQTDDSPNPSLLAYAVLGNDDDLRKLTAALSADEPSVRVAAADALSKTPRGVEPLLAAAAGATEIEPYAAAALGRFRATPEGVSDLLGMSDPGVVSVGLAAMGTRMPIESVSVVVRSVIRAPDETVQFLTPLLDRPGLDPADPEVGELLEMLAEVSLKTGTPEIALRTAERVKASPMRVSWKIRALLAMGRSSEAWELGATKDVWVDVFAKSTPFPDMEAVRERALTEFEGQLTDEDRARLGA